MEPCFSEYRQLSVQFGAEVLSVQGTREQHFRAGVEEIAGLLEQVELLFLGQPNNPNGVQYAVEELRLLAQKAESCGTYLAVDEALLTLSRSQSEIHSCRSWSGFRIRFWCGR